MWILIGKIHVKAVVILIPEVVAMIPNPNQPVQASVLVQRDILAILQPNMYIIKLIMKIIKQLSI